MGKILGFSINLALLGTHLSKSKVSAVELVQPAFWIMYRLYDMGFDSLRGPEISTLAFSAYREFFPGGKAARQ
jgi:hypothetical protein